ncbi:site-specific integrase [Desulfuromonas sp. TF]|uniref:tyrosine-type recombinase/integrase n=1 Tax=Desulfuromonas sp. TF TaxID=1232410 RepID=UPI0003FC244F|nr:site-specific integrase [Desulfuromonas sp. TF]
MKFTDKYIASLKPEGKMVDKREGGGFGIRVLPSGVKTFFYIYRFDGVRRFLNLGHYDPKRAGRDDTAISLDEARSGGVSLSGARKLYTEAKAKVDKGIDVFAEKALKAEERLKAPTVAELADEYLTRYAKMRKRSWEEDERILKRDVIPAWGRRKAADITKRDINLLLDRIIDRGAPVMANNTFKIIRRMFNYAVEKDILVYSPALGVKLPSPKVERERVLSEDEIKVLWSRLDEPSLAMSPEVRRALKLVLVTAQRPGEVIGMNGSEIDGRWWTVPTGRAKNKKAHRVYLTDLALELIGDTTGEGYVFPSPRKATGQHILRHALSRAIVNNCPSGCVNNCASCENDGCKEDGKEVEEKNTLGVAHFTPHDLRRTAATFMAEAGEMDEVIDAVLNHVKEGVKKVYNLYRYDKEKRVALEAWERKLKAIVAGTQPENVIPLRRSRKG